jgi:hypothetical protein
MRDGDLILTEDGVEALAMDVTDVVAKEDKPKAAKGLKAPKAPKAAAPAPAPEVPAAEPELDADIELEYPVPADSDAVKEVAKCVQYCKQALA